MALASILGPFAVHLLKFTLDTHSGSFVHYLGLLDLGASTSHAKVPSKAPSTGLSRTSSKTYIFSRIITANRIKPLVARSTNVIVT